MLLIAMALQDRLRSNPSIGPTHPTMARHFMVDTNTGLLLQRLPAGVGCTEPADRCIHRYALAKRATQYAVEMAEQLPGVGVERPQTSAGMMLLARGEGQGDAFIVGA